MELILAIVLRAVERLVGVAIGGFLAWLGYRLFLDVPVKADSSGNFKLPGGSTIRLTRVAPGVFFSLFGTAIVFVSFIKPVDFKQARADVGPSSLYSGAPTGSITTSFSSAAPAGAVAQNVLETERKTRRLMIAALNNVPAYLKPELGDAQRIDLLEEIRRAKLALMQPVWGEDWGDLVRFQKWVESIEAGSAPNSAAEGFYKAQ